MADPHSTSLVSLSNLRCTESKDFLLEEFEDEDRIDSIKNADFTSDDEYVKLLFDKETQFSYESFSPEKWIEVARREAISWIFKTGAELGFRYQTVYLSMTYFDRFLVKQNSNLRENGWVIPTLSVACLSLAGKMEEMKVTRFSEFHVEEISSNVRRGDFLKMELLVLNTLGWKMRSVTPFGFLQFFIIKFCNQSQLSDSVYRTVQIILGIMKEINLMEFRPSVIAASAALMTLEHKLSREELELKVNSISHYGFLDIEDLCTCYNKIQTLEVEKIEIPEFINTPIPDRSIFQFRNDMEQRGKRTRRKLTFDD